MGVALVSRTHVEPYLWNHPKDEVFADQHFSFAFEDMKIEKIDYDLKLGKIISSTPMILANQTLKNDSSRDQEMSFQINETATHTSTFEYSLGFTISIGAKISGEQLSMLLTSKVPDLLGRWSSICC